MPGPSAAPSHSRFVALAGTPAAHPPTVSATTAPFAAPPPTPFATAPAAPVRLPLASAVALNLVEAVVGVRGGSSRRLLHR